MHFVKAKSILSAQNGMNIYRGCTHGCIYCDTRSLCYGFNHRFEDIEVKINAPELLYEALARKRRPCVIGTGAMCDPYLHCEWEPSEGYPEGFRLTRRCLEIIDAEGFGLTIQTKSDRILRDLDLLTSINERLRCTVEITMTTFDEKLCRIVEPNVCTTLRRYLVLKELQRLGIPTVVWLTPLLPYLNDTEENLRGILDYCFDAGVSGIVSFGMGMTLRDGDREYYYAALDRFFPGLKERYISEFGRSYELPSRNAVRLEAILRDECTRHGVLFDPSLIFARLHELPGCAGQQLTLF